MSPLSKPPHKYGDVRIVLDIKMDILFAMMLAGASVTTVWAQGQLPSGTLSSSGGGPSYTYNLTFSDAGGATNTIGAI